MNYWILAILPALLVLGVPVAFVLLVGSVLMMSFGASVPWVALAQTLYNTLDLFALLVVPFFLFVGDIMSAGSMSRRITDWVVSMFGTIPGARGYTTVGASTAFGAISGSSIATVFTMSKLMYPELKDRYGERFSSGLIASTGAIDILIPPSVHMILFALVAQVSIIQLFTAGILPGLLLSALTCVYIWCHVRYNKIDDTGVPFSWQSFLTSSRQGFWALTTPVVIFAGIYGGVFSPTEAAAVTSAYCVLVACVIYRDVSWRDLVSIATTSVKTSGQILLLIAVSGLFSWLLTINGVANSIMEFARVNIVDTWAVLLGINVLLLVVGCFVDPISAILILTPLMVPIAQAFDINLIHLGVIVCLNLGIGMFHPPFGLNLFATQAALKVSLDDLYMGIIPFVGVALAALVIVTYVPWFSLALLK